MVLILQHWLWEQLSYCGNCSSSQRQDERWWYAATQNNQNNILWDEFQAVVKEQSIFSGALSVIAAHLIMRVKVVVISLYTQDLHYLNSIHKQQW